MRFSTNCIPHCPSSLFAPSLRLTDGLCVLGHGSVAPTTAPERLLSSRPNYDQNRPVTADVSINVSQAGRCEACPRPRNRQQSPPPAIALETTFFLTLDNVVAVQTVLSSGDKGPAVVTVPPQPVQQQACCPTSSAASPPQKKMSIRFILNT